MLFLVITYGALFLAGFKATEIGMTDTRHIILILVLALVTQAFAQLLWIWAAGRLGILLASFHMNAVPFYVMVTVVLLLGGEWNAMQAVGAALVAAGVMVAQTARQK
jgi:drug/metabolite transporter (DMT)-like permease